MKTTLDLPSDLLREMELRAVHEGRKLKDVVAEILRRGLAQPKTSESATIRHRVKLPLIKAKPGSFPIDLTGERIHKLEMESEMESYEESLRH